MTTGSGPTNSSEQEQQIETHVGQISTHLGTPTSESVEKLYDEMDLRNAITAYIWGIPAAGNASWRHAWETVFGAEDGQFVETTTLQDRRGTMTPNNVASYTGTLPLNFPRRRKRWTSCAAAISRASTAARWRRFTRPTSIG